MLCLSLQTVSLLLLQDSDNLVNGTQREKILDGILLEVEDLRNKLADLLLDVPHDEEDRDKVGSSKTWIVPFYFVSSVVAPK